MNLPTRLLTVVVCCVSTIIQAQVNVTQKKQPNIVFIFTDDHALRAISAYGGSLNQTPNIDRIAKEGMLFKNALVTNSICGPSRAVILTGAYSHINGFSTNEGSQKFDSSQTTFPKLLQANGYQTALIGKWHLNSTPTGFDYWNILPGQGSYYNPDFISAAGRERKPGYVTDVITDKALAWLDRARDKKAPFLLMLQHKAPHRHWQPGMDHINDFDNDTFPEPATLFDDYSGRASGAKNQEMEIGKHMQISTDNKLFASLDSMAADEDFKRMTPEQRRLFYEAYKSENESFLANPLKGASLVRWKYQRYIKDYLRTVKSVDDNIGRVLAYLQKEGLMENTIIVYSSDQGFYLGEHGWFDKRWMYEESLHMPFIIRWPGVVKPGSINNNLVLNLDFAETFLAAAGIASPKTMQGKSLIPLLKGEPAPTWRKAMYYHYTEYPKPHRVPPHFGIRTERHKLIYYYTLKEWEFFDLTNDPQEMHNGYKIPTNKALIHKLKLQLKQLQIDYSDPIAQTVKF